MTPAMRPACSASLPRVADTISAVACLSTTGRAPYFRAVAMSDASDCEKLPEMVIWSRWNEAASIVGAVSTLLSRTMAIWPWDAPDSVGHTCEEVPA